MRYRACHEIFIGLGLLQGCVLTEKSHIASSSEIVKIAVYDVSGRKLHELLDSPLNAGDYTINWDAVGYASGIYIIHMHTAGFTLTQKAVLLK